MGLSLAFHILFGIAGMAMPLMMAIAETVWLRTGNQIYLELAKRWSKGTAILFAVGAVSGTALSFELGLLWPGFMKYAGPVIGTPFSLEGFAFFFEAIFLGIYLYGWNKISPKMHCLAGYLVAFFGLASGTIVIAVNAWMNTPAGFTTVAGTNEIATIDVWGAVFNPAFPTQAMHSGLGAYCAVAFAVLGIHCFGLLREKNNAFHLAAAKIAFGMALVATPLQMLSGDISARHVGEYQPAKLAAMEGLYKTQKGAPLALGGIPIDDEERMIGAIHIPKALSFLQTGDADAEIKGLDAFPEEDRPNTFWVHLAFQLMVACGSAMMGLVSLGAFLWWRGKRFPTQRWFLKAALLVHPLGLVAVEAGWCVTELGRQPWVIYNIMRTEDAVTPMPGLWVPCLFFTALYVFLGITVLILLNNHVFHSPSVVAVERSK